MTAAIRSTSLTRHSSRFRLAESRLEASTRRPSLVGKPDDRSQRARRARPREWRRLRPATLAVGNRLSPRSPAARARSTPSPGGVRHGKRRDVNHGEPVPNGVAACRDDVRSGIATLYSREDGNVST